jgi:hypothetical protein
MDKATEHDSRNGSPLTMDSQLSVLKEGMLCAYACCAMFIRFHPVVGNPRTHGMQFSLGTIVVPTVNLQ